MNLIQESASAHKTTCWKSHLLHMICYKEHKIILLYSIRCDILLVNLNFFSVTRSRFESLSKPHQDVYGKNFWKEELHFCACFYKRFCFYTKKKYNFFSEIPGFSVKLRSIVYILEIWFSFVWFFKIIRGKTFWELFIVTMYIYLYKIIYLSKELFILLSNN